MIWGSDVLGSMVSQPLRTCCPRLQGAWQSRPVPGSQHLEYDIQQLLLFLLIFIEGRVKNQWHTVGSVSGKAGCTVNTKHITQAGDTQITQPKHHPQF
jgi:hypothetical protein